MCEHQKKFQDIILLDWSEPRLPGSDGAQARAVGNVAGSRDYKLSDIIWIQPDKMKARMYFLSTVFLQLRTSYYQHRCHFIYNS